MTACIVAERLMRLLVSWVRDFVDVTASPEEIAERSGCAASRSRRSSALGERRRRHRLRGHGQPARLPQRPRLRARDRRRPTTCRCARRRPDTGARVALAPVDARRVRAACKVTLEDAELCPRYAAAVADVTPTVTPAWMTARLQAAGVRPISPFVDITNYVLMELGHPMHAFDLATLGGQRAAHPARRGRASASRRSTASSARSTPTCWSSPTPHAPQAVAGVMGGADSEVSGATRTVAFESAYFKPASVRRTSKRLGLKTEASARFERGADVNAPVVALQRAIALMQQIGAGRRDRADRRPVPASARPKTLHLRRDRLARLLGLRVPDAEVERILEPLGLTVAPPADGWDVVAPTFRVDLAARSRSHRGGRPAPRLRQARADVSRR